MFRNREEAGKRLAGFGAVAEDGSAFVFENARRWLSEDEIRDGLAMGSTMRAAIELCRKKKAQKVVVAVPVAGERVALEMRELADETVVLEIPKHFQAVAQVYENWYDVSDQEVLDILEEWDRSRKQTEKSFEKNQS